MKNIHRIYGKINVDIDIDFDEMIDQSTLEEFESRLQAFLIDREIEIGEIAEELGFSIQSIHPLLLDSLECTEYEGD